MLFLLVEFPDDCLVERSRDIKKFSTPLELAQNKKNKYKSVPETPVHKTQKTRCHKLESNIRST